MPTDKSDPLLWAARRERSLCWLHTDLTGYPTLHEEDETEETLAATPKPEQLKNGKREQEEAMRCDRSHIIGQRTMKGIDDEPRIRASLARQLCRGVADI